MGRHASLKYPILGIPIRTRRSDRGARRCQVSVSGYLQDTRRESMKLWLQISAGQGPAECQWVVRRVMEAIAQEAIDSDVSCRSLEATPGDEPDVFKSVLLALDGDQAERLARSWAGTVQWTGQSRYRPHHKRKNWFVGIDIFTPPEHPQWSAHELRVDVMRSSGPGGQHVNKTSSAVRVTHVPTGLTAVAREERSQHQNRRLALARLARIMEQRTQASEAGERRERWQQHAALERGNPVRVYRGPRFQLRSRKE